MLSSEELKGRVVAAREKYGLNEVRLEMVKARIGYSTATFLLKGEYAPEIKDTLAGKLLEALANAEACLKARAS
jgi:hypothetical protein